MTDMDVKPLLIQAAELRAKATELEDEWRRQNGFRLCTSTWHNEGHSWHSTCPSCNGKSPRWLKEKRRI